MYVGRALSTAIVEALKRGRITIHFLLAEGDIAFTPHRGRRREFRPKARPIVVRREEREI